MWVSSSLTTFLDTYEKGTKLARISISTYARSMCLQTEALDILPKQNLKWNAVCLSQ